MQLAKFRAVGGTKVTLLNSGKPTVKPLTQRDLRRLANVVGEIVGGKWQAVVGSVAYIVRIETPDC